MDETNFDGKDELTFLKIISLLNNSCFVKFRSRKSPMKLADVSAPWIVYIELTKTFHVSIERIPEASVDFIFFALTWFIECRT